MRRIMKKVHSHFIIKKERTRMIRKERRSV